MTTSPLFKRVPTRAELESKNSPREFLLDDPKERQRLFFECRGFLHTCHFKHGTDWEGRRFAIEALDKLAASPEPPAEEVETLRERVKELEETLAPFSLIGGPLNKVTEGVFPDDASARFLNLGELKAKHFRVAATALDRARAKGDG